MKKYEVRVYYTVMDTVVVEAEESWDAIAMASEIVGDRSLNDMECIDTNFDYDIL